MITKMLDNSVVRFLVVGGVNTVATYAVFIALGLVIPPSIAYLIAFALGLIVVVFGSSRFVFRASGGGARRLVAFGALYLVVLGLGQFIIHLIKPEGFWPLVLTSVIVIAVTTPLNYLGGRFIFRAATNPANPEKEELTT